MKGNEVNNVEIRNARKAIADKLGVEHNEEGTEYYGMRSDSIAWMCVFHKHETCVAIECICDCHKPPLDLIVFWV